MTLPEIITDATAMLKRSSVPNGHVTIAREGEHVYQVRFEIDASMKRGYRVLGRRWLDEREKVKGRASPRGTVGPFVGWSRWSAFLGWNVEGVLAQDWRFV